jgi:polyhydroxyalkanoate synthesis regulator phasin
LQKAKINTPAIILVMALAITILPSASTARGAPQDQAMVDLALLLDTSNSMDGLISQAKSQLWTIVQQFARARKYHQAPFLRVALFEYGNTNLPVNEGYLRQVVPLTDDLDALSEALFSLTTQGGDEYCGQVIDEAITRLDWSERSGAYRAIFIAGNEPFTQGGVHYQNSCERAVGQGVVVNTIHCGPNQEGIKGKWQHGALLGHGKYFNIDQDRVVAPIPCPQDREIMRLNEELNATYLWYGSRDKRMYYESNQQAQDANAGKLSSSVAVSRSVTKSGKMYDNRSRDLVDALESDADILAKVSDQELPDEMQEMTAEERKIHLQEVAAQRAELRKKIGELSVAREKFLEAERLKRAEETGEANLIDDTLGDAVVKAIQEQLVEAGFDLK